MRLFFNTSDLDRRGTAVTEHLTLLELMKKKDVQGGIDLMRKHIQKSREHFIASLNREVTYQSL